MSDLTGFSDVMPCFTDEWYEAPEPAAEEEVNFRPWHDPIRSEMPEGILWHHSIS